MTDHRAKVREIVRDARVSEHLAACNVCERDIWAFTPEDDRVTDRILDVIGGWRPIEEAKEFGIAPILCFGNRCSWSDGYTIQLANEPDRYPHENVTDFMPLPAPPEQSDD